MKTIYLTGATGSIGLNTLLTIDHLNRHYDETNQSGEKLEVKGISARSNLDQIRRILKQYPVSYAAIDFEENLKTLTSEFPEVTFYQKSDQVLDENRFDLIINALSGSAGLLTTLKAIPHKSRILLANKESLVMAGHLINQQLKEHQSTLLPIDSEHSAIFLLLKNYRPEEVEKIILTASGGPFFRNPKENPTVEEALNHPNWKMGKKITIDSATMMNKGLEVIEAHHLFQLDYDRIETIIHPQSIVHSFIETVDGELYGQLGSTDMRHPIQNALTYPQTLPSGLKKFNLINYPNLEFYQTNFEQFPMLRIAYECGRKGGSYPIVMNAANEEIVYLFLDGKIDFNQIPIEVDKAIEQHQYIEHPGMDEILELDRSVKKRIRKKFP